jgi:hypothetical protein
MPEFDPLLDLQRRVQELERTVVRLRIGDVIGPTGSDITLGDSATTITGVPMVGRQSVGDTVAVLTAGAQILALGHPDTGGMPAAKGVRTTTFNVNNAVPGTTAMPFDAVDGSGGQQFESHTGMLNTTTGTISLPEDGLYALFGHFQFPAVMLTGTLVDLYFSCGLLGVGSRRGGEMREAPGGTVAFMATISGFVVAQAGDSVSLAIGQNTGALQATGALSGALPPYLAVAMIRGRP